MDQELKRYLDDNFARIDERFEKCATKEDLERVETKLLTAFYDWARPMELRVTGVTNSVHAFDERLSLMERRVFELERRRPS
jgi:hypothetical protein